VDNPPGRARNPRGQGGRLRDELIVAAIRLLADVGDADRLSIRAVTNAAGVSAPALYRHFPDRRSLLRAVVEYGFDAFDRALDAAAAGTTDPFDALRRRCLAYVAFAAEQPALYRMLFTATSLGPKAVGTYGRGPHPGAASFNDLVNAVQRCLDAGAGSPHTSFFIAIQVWTMLHGAADLRTAKPEMPWPPVDTFVHAGLTALGLARPARRTHRR
jgi:AcrR family transcriptional regulator